MWDAAGSLPERIQSDPSSSEQLRAAPSSSELFGEGRGESGLQWETLRWPLMKSPGGGGRGGGVS